MHINLQKHAKFDLKFRSRAVHRSSTRKREVMTPFVLGSAAGAVSRARHYSTTPRHIQPTEHSNNKCLRSRRSRGGLFAEENWNPALLMLDLRIFARAYFALRTLLRGFNNRSVDRRSVSSIALAGV